MSAKTIRVAIIGARAFTAREVLRIALRHPNLEVTALQARVDSPEPIENTHGEYANCGLPPVEPVDASALEGRADAVFLCLPHTVGSQYAKELFGKGMRIFDLGADFRFFDVKLYEKTYGVTHPCPELNGEGVYGLPEFYAEKIRDAQIVAGPGCYPTAVILALAPLVRNGLLVENSVIADCKTGVSGAGRTLAEDFLYSFVNESISAYKVGQHRHEPEMEEQLSAIGGAETNVMFVPHLVPMDRGILATCYGTLADGVGASDIRAAYEEIYADKKFVRVLPEGTLPKTKNVSHTNFCDVNFVVHEKSRRVIALSAIDNLVKGASGGVVQSLNVAFGFDETAGLL